MAYKPKVATVSEGGTGAATLTGVLTGNGTGAITASTITQHGVLLAGASNSITTVAPGTSGNVLTSNGTTWTSSASSASGGYILSIRNGSTGNPVDATTYFMTANGFIDNVTSTQFSRIYIPLAGTITRCYGDITVSQSRSK